MSYRVSEDEVVFSAIRAQGAGGQHVNKVASAVQLRFDVSASALPDALKARVLALADQRLNAHGVLVIKAQNHRSQTLNRQDALSRLQALLDAASCVPKVRQATRPGYGARQRRLNAKGHRGQLKANRSRVREGGGGGD